MKNGFLLFLFLISHLGFSQNFKFDFGTGKVAKKHVRITPEMAYTKEHGYGYMMSGTRFFTVDLPEGNYDVKVVVGNEKEPSETTIKVENRRLMLEKVVTEAGKFEERTFTVNIRNPQISAAEKVKLKPRELDYLHWDNQLTFEFCGKNPRIKTLEISPNPKAVTVFLAGNSTVVDQAQEPFAAWGQMIPSFFQPGAVVFANHAESGESLRSFLAEKRLDKILSQMKTGDYLFIEFAHNDQKQKDLRPFVEYKELVKKFIYETKAKGGIPVLVTSMHRRSFDSTGHIKNTLGDFPEAMRQTAQEEHVTLVDLHDMSKTLWETLGPITSKKAFVHYPAGSFPNQEKPLADDTHFSNYGAYQLAKCIVEGLKKAQSPLTKWLLPNLPPFDPAHPDALDTWDFPQSPLVNVVKPDGN
ncbi:MAG: rhamnogalacturonan acetylesterase [Spirosomataceae bacterium]